MGRPVIVIAGLLCLKGVILFMAVEGGLIHTCPDGWHLLGDKCYFHGKSATSWYYAQSICVNLGANLASVHGSSQMTAINTKYGRHLWIGANDISREGVWEWSDGTPFNWNNWKSGEPYDAGGEDCVVLWSVGWNDIPCGEKKGYLCLKKPRDCHTISHCSEQKCHYNLGISCQKCEDEGTNKANSVFWPSTDRKQCLPTCSFHTRRHCWPGYCSDRLLGTCSCEDGFIKTGDGSCDINTKAELLTCKIGIEDEYAQVKNSTSSGNSTSCDFETDTYVNIQPVALSFKLTAHFEKKLSSVKPNYISRTRLGIVDGMVTFLKRDISGSQHTLSSITLRGGGHCNETLSSFNPSASSLDCNMESPAIYTLFNGEWICARIDVSSGGSYIYTDFNGTNKGTNHFNPVIESKTLCFKYDDVPPSHCSAASSCQQEPLRLSTRVTKSANFSVSTSGWQDPYPQNGRPDQASDVDFFMLEVYGVKHLGLHELTVDHTTNVFKSDKLRGSIQNITVSLPVEPAMYVTYLEVHDVVGNVKYARRFLLYDNTSRLEFRVDKHLRADSASKATAYSWQINNGSIKVSWTNRYHNDHYINNDYFVPIKADVENSINGIYDQHTGVLPVTGTKSVNGVTSFKYQWALNNGSKIPWTPVPDFTNQSLTLDLNLTDGETYEVWIMAEDIMLNSIVDSVVVHIDRSVASIADTWLVREGTSKIYVHHSTDLSKMVLQFRTFDVHSGITSVLWALGTSEAVSDLGRGSLPVIKFKDGETCPHGDTCYCPSVGPCQYQNFTLTLNSLVAANTINGQHNREYYFTLHITNGAMLESFDHLDVLVDDSPPEVGVVQEGAAGGPDIDYTSEDHVRISWGGFIDHESGIKQYIVGLTSRCLTVGELKEGNSSEVIIEQTALQTISIRFPAEGSYFTSIIALNNAMEPSAVVCSDGVMFDLSPPVIENIHLHQATAPSSIHCIDDRVWLINLNLTMTELPTTTACFDRCKLYSSANNIRLPIVFAAYINKETANSFCRDLPYFNNTVIYTPFDKIILNWSIAENDSQILDTFIGFGKDRSRLVNPDLADYEPAHGTTVFRRHRTGYGGSSEFYIFIKVENKAGLSSVAIFGPVLIDDTPPSVHGVLKPEVVGDHVRVVWHNGTFSDPEQVNNQFRVTYRAVMGQTYVTPILETPRGLRMICKIEGHADCIQYPLHSLQLEDSELGRPCIFELYVFNSAGHFTTVRTESVLLPSRFPPGPATVVDLNPDAVDSLVDVDYHRNNTACIHWYGFHHHRNVTLEVGVGSAKGLDDVESFQAVTHTNVLITCVTSVSLKPFTRYFTSIRASCSGGSSVSSSDGFVYVTDNPEGLSVNDGHGCEPSDKFLISQTDVISTPDDKTEFFHQVHLHEGFLYSLHLHNATSFNGLSVESDHIVIQDKITNNSSFKITFFPLSKSPIFTVSSLRKLHLVSDLYSCVNDTDYQSSATTYALNWRTGEPYSSFITNYKLQLFENACNETIHDGCLSDVKESTVKAANYTSFTFTSLQLQENVEYVGSVTPCFGLVCLTRRLSTGIRVSRKPVIGNLVSEIEDETSDCTKVSLKVQETECRDSASDSNVSYVVQWAVLKSEANVSPVTSWQRLDITERSGCLKLPIHSYQKLYTCVRVFCPSGEFDKKCVELTLNPYAESYKDHVLFELPADDSRLVNVEDLLHSKHLGTRLGTLHEMDVDFVNISSRISAVVTNAAGHNITWYMMKGKPELPVEDCDTDVSCEASKTSQNGRVRFGKIAFEESEPYYVCANASERGGEAEFTVCGNGFIVDNSPPIAGSVTITNAAAGFITDASHMVITWSGFNDVLPRRGPSYAHGIKSFSIAIGNYQHGGNIHPWTRVGDSTSYVAHNLQLQNGEEYYVTVRAEDHVGHVKESVSPAVVADLTPPLCGDISVEGLLPHRNEMTAKSLHIHLKDIQDPESSIHALHLSVLTPANADNAHLYLKPGTDFVELKVDGSFVDGHRYQIKVQVTNNAGLHTACMSRHFMIDNSPPQAGVVRDGRYGRKDEADHQEDTTMLDCHWSGFSDPHSGIRDYRVGLGTSPSTLDVQPLQSVGLTCNHTWELIFVPGVKYYSTVESCNGAGLCTTISSDGISMDGSPPVAGVVIVGHTDTHHKYHGHKSYVYSHWVGFEDAETGIHHFECCIGSNQHSCDVLNFTNTALSDSYFTTGLDLPLSVPLYVTVRAFNPIGLFVEATSPSFIVDDTPPRVIKQPVFISTSSDDTHNITAQWDNSLLFVKWKFSDEESPIHEHVLTFRTHHESAVAVETIKLGPQLSHLLVLPKENRFRNGDRYKVSVSSCNRAGLCTTSHSPDILIDSTPPLLGGFKPPLNWETIHVNGSVASNVSLTWYCFDDSESNISHYQISIGRTYEGAELTHGAVKIGHDVTVKEQTVTLQLSDLLSQGENIVLSIWAENGLGLTSSIGKVTVSVVSTNRATDRGMLEIQRHSCDVHYCTKDCTCAVVGWKCRPPSNPMTCKDMSNSTSVPDVLVHPGTLQQSQVFQIPSLSCISGHWKVIGNSTVAIRRYEWSMGLEGEQTGAGIFNITDENIWYDAGKRTEIVHCLPYDRALQHGEDYLIYIRAWYTATEYSVFTSQSIRVDHTPPSVRRGRILQDSDATCLKDFDIFHVNQSSIRACWKGLFQETQTSIREYLVWAGVTKYGTDLLPIKSVGLSTNISLPVENITPGTKYFVGVRAVNTMNMSTTVISDGFLLDADHPVGGHVFNTEYHKNRLAQSENTSIGVSWNGFQDHHSSVKRYLIQISDHNSSDVISEVNVTLRNSLLMNNINLEHGKRYIASVAAEDFAGHTGEVVTSQPIIVDTTPPTGFVCENYTQLSSINISFERTDVASYILNHFHVDMINDVDSHFRIRITTAAGKLENEMAHFMVGKLYAQVPFIPQQNHTLYSAEYQFTLESNSSISTHLEITVQAKVSLKDADVTVEACCNKASTSGSDAITTKQLTPSLLSICARVVDTESGVKNIQIGVGTTRDGYQIQTLRPAVARFHELLEVDVPHGAPVFTTVIAENHAGLKTYFLSDPITMDHTAPSVTNIRTQLMYKYKDKMNSEVQVHAFWLSEDLETKVADCWCSLGHKNRASDLHGLVPSTSTSSCQLLVPNATHGLQFYLTVQCCNTVEMHTVMSSGPIQILLKPPSSNGSTVDIVVQNKYSQHSGDIVQSTKSSLKFQWTWLDSKAVSHYQCRADGFGMSDWINTSLRYCEFSSLQLKDGGRYTAEVRAVDLREQTSEVVSAAVTVDSTTPQLTGTKATVQWKSDSIIIHYGYVFHHLSEQLKYTISVGSSHGYSDYLHQLTTHHDDVTLKLPVTPSEIHVTLTAEAPVGTSVTYTDTFHT